MRIQDRTLLRATRLRFQRTPEMHVIEIEVYTSTVNDALHIEVDAVYEEGMLGSLCGHQIASMGVQYEYPLKGNDGSLNIGDATTDRVDIATEGLRGIGLGSAMFSEIVTVLQGLKPVTVIPFYLSEEDADDANRERRNRFYERFGVKFNYFDNGRRGGESIPMSSHALIVPGPSDRRGWMITKV